MFLNYALIADFASKYAASPFVIWSGQLVGLLPHGKPLNFGMISLIFIFHQNSFFPASQPAGLNTGMGLLLFS